MKSFKTFIQDLNELNLTSSADVNEILLAWYMVDSDWRKVHDGRKIKSLYDKVQSSLSDEEFENQSERAWAMATAIDEWSAKNGYRGGIVKSWWTARKGVLSKAVGYEVDSRKNPTDVLLQFGDKQFLGISAKSTKGKGDIGFKNPGAGTFDRILGSSLSDMIKRHQTDFATKHNLSHSASIRKKEIRSDDTLIKASGEARTLMLNDLRNHLMKTFSSMKEDDLREFILDECMDAKPILPKYIKVTGHGKSPNYSASIHDPLKDDKATAVAADTLEISNVGNDSIGILAGGMKILKVRLKQESQAMASALKISCDPWK
jgi:hypothetical protein